MRRRTTVLILLALLGGGCGLFADPFPTSTRIEERIPAGDSVKDTADVGSISEDGWWLGYSAEVDDLPPGIHYDTEGFGQNLSDDLILAYRIRVDDWVEPGLYRFHVHYRYTEDEDDWFRTEVIVRFSVWILEPEPEEEGAPLELRVVQTVPADQAEAAVAITSPR